MPVIVSVIMPTCNAARYIKESVQSVLNQTYREFELIIIDDASQDGTENIIKRIAEQDARIVLIRNKENMGVSQSRNIGVRCAKGLWVAFLDSDDLWDSQKLEKQMDLICSHPEAVITFTASAFMDESGKRYSAILPAPPVFTYQELLKRDLLSCSSVVARRDWMLRYPMTGAAVNEDYAVWLRVLREIPCAYGLNEPLLIYRVRRHSRSAHRIEAIGRSFRTYRYVGFSRPRAFWLVFRYGLYSLRKWWKICHWKGRTFLWNRSFGNGLRGCVSEICGIFSSFSRLSYRRGSCEKRGLPFG